MSNKSKRSITIIFVTLMIVFVLFTLGIFSYAYNLRLKIKTESQEYITKLTSQSVVSVQTAINQNRALVSGLTRYINISEKISQDEILQILQEFDFGEYYVGSGLILPDRTCCSVDGHIHDYSAEEFFSDSMNGAFCVATPHYDKTLDTNIATYSAPVYSGDDVFGVIYVNYDMSIYENALNRTRIEGSGNSYITNRSGMILAASQLAKTRGAVFKNISDIILDEEKYTEDVGTLDRIRQDFLLEMSGFAEVKVEGIDCYICYQPIGVNDWSLVSTMPISVFDNRQASTMFYTVFVCSAVVILFFVLMLVFIAMYSKNRIKFEKIAFEDVLTGHTNYTKFLMDSRYILNNNNSSLTYAIIVTDVDKFKYFNDMYGYDTGNSILKKLAYIFNDTIKENEAVGRVNSDIFALLIGYKNDAELKERLDRLCNKLDTMSRKMGYGKELIVAMGVYEVVNPDLEIQSMVDRAIIAKKTVKGTHKSSYGFYDDKIRSEVINEKKIESEMNAALRDGQFEVFYQPKYFISNLKLSGAEALVRWRHPQRGLIPPFEFVPIFEKNGFIVQVDLQVFTLVCRDLRRWLDEKKNVVPISVNLSRKHLANPNFLQLFEDVMNEYDIPPNLIEFEITESTIFENDDALLKLLNNIHNIGCLFSMDDFGTGYSSLNMLKDIPVDILKLDREFLNYASENVRSKEIISSVVSLAKKLNIHVVAEGVEDADQLEFLKEISCDVAQGYYFSKPVALNEFELILEKG